MGKAFEVNTKLDFLTYVKVVNDIVAEFFNDEGEYCPHIGRAYVMQLFYKLCVISEELNEKIENIDDVNAVNILASHRDFLNAFNYRLSPSGYGFDFANAYNDAMEIVEDRKNSISRITKVLENAVSNVMEQIEPAMKEDVLAAIMTISQNMTGGKSAMQAIADTVKR